jgi:hypothetical protein
MSNFPTGPDRFEDRSRLRFNLRERYPSMFFGREQPPPFQLASSSPVRGRPVNAGAAPFVLHDIEEASTPSNPRLRENTRLVFGLPFATRTDPLYSSELNMIQNLSLPSPLLLGAQSRVCKTPRFASSPENSR